jgi:hypothetical protein
MKEINKVKAELQHEKKTTEASITSIKGENDELKAQKIKLKEEWAEIYLSMKADIDGLKSDIKILNNENDKLLKLTDTSNSQSRKSEMEIMKKLNKRELECSALWDTIRDIYKGHAIASEKQSLEKLFAVRALDMKAKSKVFK